MKTYARITLFLLLSLPSVLPASLVNDRKIERAARASYIYRTVLQDRVKVSAEFGVLTLTGAVEDLADKALAEDTVKNIPAVGGVENKITILPSYREESDPWIALKILARLRVRANVSADTTRIAVQDGMVTLTGTARDATQRERTGSIAREITGVNDVRNNLVVAAPLPGEGAPAELVDDASITGQVISALRGHEGTRALGIAITTTEGVIRISGEAGTEAQKALVTQIARDVHGAGFVTNRMKVRN